MLLCCSAVLLIYRNKASDIDVRAVVSSSQQHQHIVAAEDKATYANTNTYFGTAQLNKHWSIPFDFQARIRNGISDKGQILNRAGLQYMPGPTGYTYGYFAAAYYAAMKEAYLFLEQRTAYAAKARLDLGRATRDLNLPNDSDVTAAEIDGILAGLLRQLVHEAFDGKDIAVGADPAPKAGGHGRRFAPEIFDTEVGNAIGHVHRAIDAIKVDVMGVGGRQPARHHR